MGNVWLLWGAGMAQCWEHFPPTNLSWVQFLVMWFEFSVGSRPCSKGFSPCFPFSSPEPRSFWPATGIESSGFVEHRKSAIHGLPVKSDWLRIWNEYSVHVQKIGFGQSSPLHPGLKPCRGGGACVPRWPWELCRWGLRSRAGLAMPDWSKGRGQTKNSPWSSRLGVGQQADNTLPEKMNLLQEPKLEMPLRPIGKQGYNFFFDNRALHPCHRSEGSWLWGRECVFSGFPPSSKINIFKFQFDREFDGH